MIESICRLLAVVVMTSSGPAGRDPAGKSGRVGVVSDRGRLPINAIF